MSSSGSMLLIAALVVSAALAVHAQWQAAKARSRLAFSGGGWRDPTSGLALPTAALHGLPRMLAAASTADASLYGMVLHLDPARANEIATRIAEAARRADLPWRIDQDRVGFLLTAPNRQDAARAGARFGTMFDGARPGITAIGIAEWSGDGDDFHELVDRALSRPAPVHRYQYVAGAADPTAADPLFRDRRWPRTTPRELLVRVALPFVALGMILAVAAIPAVRERIDGPHAMLLAIACVAGLLVLTSRFRTLPAEVSLAGSGLALVAGAAIVHSGHPVLASPFQVAGAMLAGYAASRLIDGLAWIAPITLLAGANDLHSFFYGYTRTLIDEQGSAPADAAPVDLASFTPASLDYIAIHVPTATGYWLVGVVDIAFMALLVAAARRWNLGPIRTAVAMVAMLAAATVAFGTAPLIPALAAGFVLVHARTIWRGLVHQWQRFVLTMRAPSVRQALRDG